MEGKKIIYDLHEYIGILEKYSTEKPIIEQNTNVGFKLFGEFRLGDMSFSVGVGNEYVNVSTYDGPIIVELGFDPDDMVLRYYDAKANIIATKVAVTEEQHFQLSLVDELLDYEQHKILVDMFIDIIRQMNLSYKFDTSIPDHRRMKAAVGEI